MWAIGFGILVALYVGAIKLLASVVSSSKKKKIIFRVSILLPIVTPFLFYAYPSYHQFRSLCTADDRKIISQVKTVDYLYLGRNSDCRHGFEHLSNYKGVDCEYAPKGKKGIFRYIRGGNWSGASCVNDCRSDPRVTESQRCKFSCMQSVNIDKITNYYTIEYSDIKLIEDRLTGTESRIIDSGEVMAITKNYNYYPYGNTWAKILGLSSGTAPRLSCDEFMYIRNTDIYKPNK